MKRIFFLALVVSLSSHAQAVRPAPMPASPPVMTPGYFPGTPSQTVHTPSGAGLPTPGQPGSGAATLPRSPNKRVLPASAEPGLWAADTVKASAVQPPDVFGVDIPFPSAATTDAERKWSIACGASMNEAAAKAGQRAVIDGMSLDDRKCLAARAYEFCASSLWARFEMARQAGEPHSPDDLEALRASHEHGAALVAAYCKSGWTAELTKLLGKVTGPWAKTFTAQPVK